LLSILTQPAGIPDPAEAAQTHADVAYGVIAVISVAITFDRVLLRLACCQSMFSLICRLACRWMKEI
jgi:hypothetical protein